MPLSSGSGGGRGRSASRAKRAAAPWSRRMGMAPVRKESRPGQHVIALDVAAPVAAAEATEDAPGEDAACPEGGEGNE